MIGVVMHVATKPERTAEFKRLVAGLRRDVHANEPGCLLYEVLQSEQEPTRFLFVELFADAAAHAAHPDMPYHVAMSAAGWACLEGQPVIERWAPLSDADAQGSAA